MVSRGLVFAVFDLFALTFLYFVLQDLAWRTSYVESRELLAASTSYSPFVRVFNISGGGIKQPLVSPPALDWVQVVVVTLILVNGFFLLTTVRKSRKGSG